MPIYSYQGRDNTGKLITGSRLAQSADSLSLLLMKEGIIPIKIQSAEEVRSFWEQLNSYFEKSVSRDEVGVFARQMYSLIKTNVPIATALKNLSTSMHNKIMSESLLGLVENIEAGQDLATSMQRYPKVFSPLMISMVKVGQSSGNLAEAFLRINQYVELEGGAIKNIKNAMRYPIFVIVATIFAIVLINVFVIPAFVNVFTQANVELPLVTQILISISNFFRHYWITLLIILLITSISFYHYIHTPTGKYRWDKFLLTVPFCGKILKRIILLRFSQSFAITINSGIPLIEGIELLSEAVDNEYARQRILMMRDAIERGNNLAQAASITNLFTPLELQILSVSEETGELGPMLDQISGYYKREVEYDLKRLGDVIEPILVIVLASVILVLAFAVYLPIWNMAQVTKLG